MSILVVDPVYNPNLVATITSATKLGPGITIAKFLGAYGDRTSFNHIGTKKEREAAKLLHWKAKEEGKRIPYFIRNGDPTDIHYFDNKGLEF